jgi:hypothetical protein
LRYPSVEAGKSYRYCVTGKRAYPPDDVSGISDFLKIVANPKHKDYQHWLEWAGGKFDPEEFDLDYANQRLQGKY